MEITDVCEIKVALVDDHTVVLQGIHDILAKRSGIRVVGLADNFDRLLHIVEHNCPDVVLMDVGISEMNGIEMTQSLLARYPDLRVLMLTGYKDEQFILGSLDAGAMGYLHKSVDVYEMVRAITAVYKGKQALCPVAIEALIRVKTSNPHYDNHLTGREFEVLQLLVAGNSNPAIAEALYITVSTVKYHLRSVYKKLGVTTRVDAVRMAVQYNLVNIDSES